MPVRTPATHSIHRLMSFFDIFLAILEILEVLRVLGKGSCSDRIEELPSMSAEVIQVINHAYKYSPYFGSIQDVGSTSSVVQTFLS